MAGSESGKSKRGCSLVMALLGLGAIALVGFLALSQIASTMMGRTRRGWEEVFGSEEQVLQRYPPREANAAALHLETLATGLGIGLAPRGLKDRERPVRGAAGFVDVKLELGGYVKDEIQRERLGTPSPPPDALAAYLKRHHARLTELTEALLEGEVPLWEMHLEKRFAARIPDLIGHVDLHKILVADALASVAAGQPDPAIDRIEASWRLAHTLWEHPLLISQLIGISAARMQVGALRHLGEVPEAWNERLSSPGFRESFLEALKYEGWLWGQFDSWATTGDPVTVDAISQPLARPYVRLCLANVSDAYRRRLVALSKVRALCDNDLSARGASLEVPVPAWNRIGGLFAPDFTNAVHRLASLELDLELTRKILMLDAARRANAGRWPRELPGIEASEVCPRDRWLYEVSPDGMTLAFSREISWPDMRGARLPKRVVSD